MAVKRRKKGKTRNLLQIYNSLSKAFGPQGWWPAETRFEVIVGAILTQNTAWVNVERAIANLKREKLLNVRALANAPVAKVRECVRPSGYFNQKAPRLKAFAAYLEKNYGAERGLERFFRQPTGSLLHELLARKGIGPETADSILLYAGDKLVFVVDAYTRRVFSRLGSVDAGVSYSELQKFFVNRLPQNRRVYKEFHALVVVLGKRVCLKREPRCSACPLRRQCKFFVESKRTF